MGVAFTMFCSCPSLGESGRNEGVKRRELNKASRRPGVNMRLRLAIERGCARQVYTRLRSPARTAMLAHNDVADHRLEGSAPLVEPPFEPEPDDPAASMLWFRDCERLWNSEDAWLASVVCFREKTES